MNTAVDKLAGHRAGRTGNDRGARTAGRATNGAAEIRLRPARKSQIETGAAPRCAGSAAVRRERRTGAQQTATDGGRS